MVVLKVYRKKTQLYRFQNEVRMYLRLKQYLPDSSIQLLNYFKYQTNGTLNVVPKKSDTDILDDAYKEPNVYYCQVYEQGICDVLDFAQWIRGVYKPRSIESKKGESSDVETFSNSNSKSKSKSKSKSTLQLQSQLTLQQKSKQQEDDVSTSELKIIITPPLSTTTNENSNDTKRTPIPMNVYFYCCLQIIQLYNRLLSKSIRDMDVALENLLFKSDGSIVKCDLTDMKIMEHNRNRFISHTAYHLGNISSQWFHASRDGRVIDYDAELWYSVGCCLTQLFVGEGIYDHPNGRYGQEFQAPGGVMQTLNTFQISMNEDMVWFIEHFLQPMVSKTYKWQFADLNVLNHLCCSQKQIQDILSKIIL